MKLCLSIGISKAPLLEPLPGAVTAAHEMGKWARKSKFITKVVTDKHKPVTVDKIRNALLGLLPFNEVVEHFILHFAGHGFRSGAEQHAWLLSDWHSETRCVSVEGLRRQFYRHGIKNLTIFSDACRSQPTDIDTADLCCDPVLPRGPYDSVPPIIDRFNAAADGQRAYMLLADSKSLAKCIFSSVLNEGLSGLNDKAFDKYHPDWITPESLAIFSRERLREIGELHDLTCTPDCTTGSPRDHVVYFKRGDRSNVAPLQEFSTPTSQSSNQAYRANESHGLQTLSLAEIKHLSGFTSSSANLIVRAPAAIEIWAISPVKRLAATKDESAYFVPVLAKGATQILVKLTSGVFVSAVVYKDLLTIIDRDIEGEPYWTIVAEKHDDQQSFTTTLAAIAALQEGKLTADRAEELSIELRSRKHTNPTLGVIACYLYDYSADIDSIRRMAYFYCRNGQSIPFDVAFMGLLSTRNIGNGRIEASVPSVPARPTTTANQILPDWVTVETKEAVGQVAGMWPWLRQGWQFIEDPEPQEKASADMLRDVLGYLLPSQFSSFKETGAQILIRKFNLKGTLWTF